MDNIVIRVAPEVLSAASSDITQKVNMLKVAVSEMGSLMNQTAGYWTGDAAELHRKLYEEQAVKMAAVIDRFRAQAEKLQQISGNYDEAVKLSKSMVEELPSDVIV